jgi:hypothetical protein
VNNPTTNLLQEELRNSSNYRNLTVPQVYLNNTMLINQETLTVPVAGPFFWSLKRWHEATNLQPYTHHIDIS